MLRGRFIFIKLVRQPLIHSTSWKVSRKSTCTAADRTLRLRETQGEVWAWGDNQSGGLGDGTTTSSNTPVQVSDLSDVQAIAAGCSYSLALKNDGSVWAWGNNSIGQLEDGTFDQRTAPVQVSGLSGVQAIAAGGAHSLPVVCC